LNILKIIFIGGLTNGKIVLDYFEKNRYVNVPLIITHPRDHSIPRYNDISGIIDGANVINDLDANKYTKIIRNLKPDFIFVTGWSGILSEEIISIPKFGTIGFHPSKLPCDRGRSVLAWQIEEGYTQTALTMFYYNEIPDFGDIITYENINIERNDYINDVLNKIDNATYNLMRAYFPLLRKSIAPRKGQNANEGNYRRLRNERDSVINWDVNAEVIYNKIRAISKPYPGAIAKIGNEDFRIWKAVIFENIPELDEGEPGKHIYLEKSDYPIVKCRDLCLRVIDFEKI